MNASDFASAYGPGESAITIQEKEVNRPDIDSHHPLTDEEITFFEHNEYIKLKQVLSAEVLNYYRGFIWKKTLELNTNHLPMEQRSTYDRAFIQVGNLWQHCQVVKQFVLGKTLGRIAAELMQVAGVRLYHDQSLFKEASGGFTPWHADQQYWPLATTKTITAWVPLQAVTMEMGPLSFAAGSHKNEDCRHLEISDESERIIQERMNQFPLDCAAFDIGEVSFHSGWMYHRAPDNASGKIRGAQTIIYMDKDMTLKHPENQNQENDRANFCPGIKVGEVVASDLNPII